MSVGVMKFRLGRVCITDGADAGLPAGEVRGALARHAAGDWGECGAEDWQENEFSLDKHLRLFSVYRSTDGVVFWVITEADRSATTVLLPDEY